MLVTTCTDKILDILRELILHLERKLSPINIFNNKERDYLKEGITD